jgi:hypothetical protein
MFLIFGTLIGLNLMVRVALGETRELQAKGHTRGSHRVQLRFKDMAAIVAKGAVFLVVPVAIGLLLDLAFDSTVGQIFD